ncbi:hypothetical protein ROLI_030980 [Roseobacter fucihabitans]|uniref:Lipoprotein n=1 Tax=Roseobacter fucihabitans TaxID=1537242 RepID=A0ABZ2BVD4_9RHOB|nr:hypothetical protein [Roseobacter litoralis]
MAVRALRAGVVFGVLALLMGCAVSSMPQATPEEIAAKTYVADGAPKLTLFTVINNNTGSGGHTALMVSGSQRVIFDPAGSFFHADVAERGDVLFGMTPGWVQAYKGAHARSTYHVVSQEFVVSPEQAERALQLVLSNGAVGNAFCTQSTSSILRQVPGFEDVKTTFYPANLMRQLATRPGVVMNEYYENDAGDVRDGIIAAQS